LTPSEGYFLTGFNYFDAVQRTMRHLEPVKADGRISTALVELLKKQPGRRIGFEGNWVTVDLYEVLREGLGANRALERADDLVRGLRVSKDAEELARIRAAVELTDRAYEDVVRQ